MNENNLGGHRPADLAKVWGMAIGQFAALWRTTVAALMELSSPEQQVMPGGQANRFSVPLVGGEMPQLAARDLVGEAFHRPLAGQAVVFRSVGGGPGSVTVECSVNEAHHAIEGDTYHGQVVDENGRVIATISLDAGS
ncbi:MAG TPA: hypothetical protein VFO01_03520 [Trebonia sp.]|nr:hypothetical protein [Trebonia sp.]